MAPIYPPSNEVFNISEEDEQTAVCAKCNDSIDPFGDNTEEGEIMFGELTVRRNCCESEKVFLCSKCLLPMVNDIEIEDGQTINQASGTYC